MKTKLAIAILIAAPALPLCAADQLADKLILDGSRQSLLGSPLQPALDADPGLVARLKKYTPQERCEALERGYLATWEVRESKLYLTRVEVDACNKPRSVPLSLLFPGLSSPVEAGWFTGELRIQKRYPILYVKGGAVTGRLNLEREKKK
jgi:hypothetical protein